MAAKRALSPVYPRPKPRVSVVREERQSVFFAERDLSATNAPPHPETRRYHENRTNEKRLGAVYTPPRIAATLTRWAVRSAADNVLDPSCSEGVFLAAARTRLADLGARRAQCFGVDIDPSTAASVGAHCEDFFSWVRTARPVNVILGNPPFIRSHLFPEPSRKLAFTEMAAMGLKPSRLMSTWAPFLALCCRLLTPDGRLAMVIPEELLAVGYAEELRAYLTKRFRRVLVCLPSRGIFPEVQQAVVLLLCDNEPGTRAGLQTITYDELEQGDLLAAQPAPVWTWTTKWSHLFLSSSERTLVTEWQQELGWRTISAFGRVEVGIVTGDNDFFLLDQERADRIDMVNLMPVVASTRDLSGMEFGADDFKRILSNSRPAYVLNVTEPKHALSSALHDYIAEGEARSVQKRYKCSIRSPWYAVPSLRACDAVLFRQAGDMPRIFHLKKKCSATDTVHRVTWHSPSAGRKHAAGFLNTWTLLNAELLGRSYGGGVLEIMPSEANALPLPEPVDGLEALFAAVDSLVREKHAEAAVNSVDQVVLPRSISRAQRSIASGILEKLVRRRQSRGIAPKPD